MVIGQARLDSGHYLIRADGDAGLADAVLGHHSQVGLAAWWLVPHDAVVQALHERRQDVDLGDDLVCHLHDPG